MTQTQINTTVYKARPPRRSINEVAMLLAAVAVLFAVLAVGYSLEWKW